MGEDLQSLLEKINRDGVEKATAAANEILADAKAKAAAIVREAQEAAEKAKAEAEAAAADYAARASETVAQAARDTLLTVEAAVTALLEKLLARNVEKVLADEAQVAALTAEAIKGLTGPLEVAVPAERYVAALREQLAAASSVEVTLDETVGTGFSVRREGGRIEHTFTGVALATELAKRLRPDLAKLVKQAL